MHAIVCNTYHPEVEPRFGRPDDDFGPREQGGEVGNHQGTAKAGPRHEERRCCVDVAKRQRSSCPWTERTWAWRGPFSFAWQGGGGGRPRGGGVNGASPGRERGSRGRGGGRGGTSSRSRCPSAGSRSSIAPPTPRSHGSVAGPEGKQFRGYSGSGGDAVFDPANTDQSEEGEPEWSGASTDGGLDADALNAAQAAAFDAEATALSGGALGRQQRGVDVGVEKSRTTVYRGDPADTGRGIDSKIDSMLNILVSKHAASTNFGGGAGNRGASGGGGVSGGGGGSVGGGNTDRRLSDLEGFVKDTKSDMKDIKEILLQHQP